MLPSGRLFYKQIDSIPKIFNSKVRVNHVKASSEEKIVIPARIEREPTDILKALASTVNKDPTAFHYKYPDDPYFYTYKTASKRVYAMAMEAGRKSAKWVIKENPGFFKHELAEPPIKIFLQNRDKVDETELTEKDLLNAIEERDVLGAIKTYETLKSNQQDIQKSTKQSLLELVCFYNSKERPELNLESKWFSGFLGKAGGTAVPKEKWRQNAFAENLFQEMDPDCPLANSALIQGFLKYGEINSAFEHFNLAKRKNIKLSVEVYNMFMSESQLFMKSRNEIFNFVTGKLSEMSKAEVNPNLGTLNAALKAFSKSFHLTVAKKIMNEFITLGIEPSLGSYGYLFKIVGNLKFGYDGQPKKIIESIMQDIENKEHEILHPSDFSFFNNAIECFSERIEDADLALRLADMYFRFNNSKFIVKGEDEYGFFKQLLLVVFKHKPLDFAMNVYRRYVFTTISPDAKTMWAVFAAIHENLQPEYLPEVWDDLKKLGLDKNRPLLGRLFQLMNDFSDESSLKVFHEMAVSFLDRSLQEFKSGDVENLENVCLALIKNDDEEMILKVVENIRNNVFEHVPLSESFIETFFEYAMSKKNVTLILESLSFSCNRYYPCTSDMAKKALPLLKGADELWASGLITKEDE